MKEILLLTGKIGITLLGSLISISVGVNKASAISLGSFNFDDNQFGDTLGESDGGSYSSSNWLNVVNSDPGNPAYLIGANFDTGIANIGLSGSLPTYTIGYNTPIVNNIGDDLGIVSARYSVSDTFQLSVSTDGINFTPSINFLPSAAIATGVNKSYYYGGGGPFASELFVTPVDLNLFGLSSGSSILAIQITGLPEADLIRVAGFESERVPEPLTILGSFTALGFGTFFKGKFQKNKLTEKEIV